MTHFVISTHTSMSSCRSPDSSTAIAKHLVVFSLIAVMASCDSSEVEQPPDPEIWPMAVGNFWELRYADHTGRIEVTDSFKTPSGETAYVFRQFTNGDLILDGLGIMGSNTANGYVRLGQIQGQDTLYFEELNLPFPASVGDTGTVSALAPRPGEEPPFAITGTTVYTVTAVDTSITTPLGEELTCSVYERIDRDGVLYGIVIAEYYCTDVGLARFIRTREIDGTLVSDHQLYEYNLN